jgi:hypothetical protein
MVLCTDSVKSLPAEMHELHAVDNVVEDNIA